MQLKSFIGLLIMVYEPLYLALHENGVRDFLAFFMLSYFSFLYVGGVFNETIIPFVLVGYEMIIVNFPSSYIQHTRSWKNC